MALLLDLVRVLLSFSLMSFWGSFSILLDLGVLCLLVLFFFGIVLLGLLAGCRPGVCLCLVMLLTWLPFTVRLPVIVGVRYLVRGFAGLVVLVLEGKEFDYTEKLLHTSYGH